jgi:hypothetical protein
MGTPSFCEIVDATGVVTRKTNDTAFWSLYIKSNDGQSVTCFVQDKDYRLWKIEPGDIVSVSGTQRKKETFLRDCHVLMWEKKPEQK